MNRKNKKNVIVLFVILVVLVAVFLFLKKHEDADFMQEETETEEEQIVLTSIDEDKVSEIEFACGEDSFILQRLETTVEAEMEDGSSGEDAEEQEDVEAEDGSEAEEEDAGWCFLGEADAKVNGSSVSSFLSNLCALTAKQEIPNVEKLEDYGITDDSDTITLQLTDDLYVFRLGDYNSLASGYYITMNDNGSVYLIDGTTYYLLNKDHSYFEDTSVDED